MLTKKLFYIGFKKMPYKWWRNEEDYCPHLEKLEKDNKELKKQLFTAKNEQNAFKIYSDGAEEDAINLNEQLTKAKEIILKLYNAGRDVLMCRAEEKAYDNLSNAINDKSIEQFLNSLK